MSDIDVTEQVNIGCLEDEECLPIHKCVCGAEFKDWAEVLSIYRDDAIWECPNCHRKLYFSLKVKVFEKKE